MEIPPGVTSFDIQQVMVDRYTETWNRILDPHTCYTSLLHLMLSSTPFYNQVAGIGPAIEGFHHQPEVIKIVDDIDFLGRRVDPEGEKDEHVRQLLIIQGLEKASRPTPSQTECSPCVPLPSSPARISPKLFLISSEKQLSTKTSRSKSHPKKPPGKSLPLRRAGAPPVRLPPT